MPTANIRVKQIYVLVDVSSGVMGSLDLPETTDKRMQGVKKGFDLEVYHSICLKVEARTEKVPLNKEDYKSWLEFKQLVERKPVTSFEWWELEEGKWPIELDHPFIPVIGNFAVDAFNAALEKFDSKDKSYNVCHHQIMACKYTTLDKHHCFFMTIEAIEEGILGVYEAVVGCDVNDGSTALVKFNLTDRRPTGKITMTLPHLICLKRSYKTMKGMKRELEIKLDATQKSMKGKIAMRLPRILHLKSKYKIMKGNKKKRKVAAEMISLKEQHKAMKGTCKMLYRQIQVEIPKTWNQRSGPESWFDCNYRFYALRPRSVHISRRGYDFNSKSPDFGMFGNIFG